MTLSPPLSSWLTPFWTDGFLAVPLTIRGSFYLWAFACALPSLWNPHGPCIPMPPSLSRFRSQLRCHPSEEPSLSARPHQLKHPPPPDLSLCTLTLLYFPFTRGEEGPGEGRETLKKRSVREGSPTQVSPDRYYVPGPQHVPRPGSMNRVRGAGCWLKGRRVKTSGQGERLGRLRSRVKPHPGRRKTCSGPAARLPVHPGSATPWLCDLKTPCLSLDPRIHNCHRCCCLVAHSCPSHL